MAFTWRGITYRTERAPAPTPARHKVSSPAEIPLGGAHTITVIQAYGRQPMAAHVLATRLCARHAEERLDALEAAAGQRMTPMEQRVLMLEQVAMNPRAFPTHPQRPVRPLAGASLYSWIAAQAGITAADVPALLARAERKIAMYERSVNS